MFEIAIDDRTMFAKPFINSNFGERHQPFIRFGHQSIINISLDDQSIS